MGGFRGASGWERGEGERGLGKSPRDAPLLIHSPRAEKHSSTRRGAHARAVCSRFRVGPVADLLQVFFFFFFLPCKLTTRTLFVDCLDVCPAPCHVKLNVCCCCCCFLSQGKINKTHVHVNSDRESRVWQHGGHAPHRSPDSCHPGALRADRSGIRSRGKISREAPSRDGAHALRVHARVPHSAPAGQPVEREGELELRPQQEGSTSCLVFNNNNTKKKTNNTECNLFYLDLKSYLRIIYINASNPSVYLKVKKVRLCHYTTCRNALTRSCKTCCF